MSPAHEPAAPEELFENGDCNDADEDAEEEEDGGRFSTLAAWCWSGA